jgi:hypothetical protein
MNFHRVFAFGYQNLILPKWHHLMFFCGLAALRLFLKPYRKVTKPQMFFQNPDFFVFGFQN